MSRDRVFEDNDETTPVGNVKSVLSAMDDGFDGRDAATFLADTAAKRDEAIICLRLIAGLNPLLREKAEKTIQELSKVPLPATEGH